MKLPFEEVYLLNLVERQDRYDIMHKQFDALNIKVKDYRVVKHPFFDVLANKCLNNDTPIEIPSLYIGSGGVLSCTREHYTLIKSAYLRGVNSICIIEDDISFLKNINILEDYFNNLPDNWDILRICSLRGKKEEEICKLYPNIKWIPEINRAWGTGCYALNRKAMEYIIKCLDMCYTPIDFPLYMMNNKLFMDTIYQCKDVDIFINCYIPNIPICLCFDNALDNDIRHFNEKTENDQDILNLNINREDYFNY